MKFDDHTIPGIMVVHFDVHADDRGAFIETFNDVEFANSGVTTPWVQDSYSVSARAMTLRGLHFQDPPHAQAKLVRVIEGRIFDVAVDLRSGSASFGAHSAIELAADDAKAILVPEGFAHAFLTLEPHTRVAYKMSAHYSPSHARGIAWDDPTLGIDWPISGDVVLSDRDAANPGFDGMIFDF